MRPSALSDGLAESSLAGCPAAEALTIAQARSDAKGEQEAQNEINALVLFQRNLGAFLRVYIFLSQIFDYGNTAIEKRSIFFRQVLRTSNWSVFVELPIPWSLPLICCHLYYLLRRPATRFRPRQKVISRLLWRSIFSNL